MNKNYESRERIGLDKIDIPLSALKNDSHVELFGNTKMILEGTYTILEYSTVFLRIKIKRKEIVVEGRDLQLHSVCLDYLVLIGVISKIEML